MSTLIVNLGVLHDCEQLTLSSEEPSVGYWSKYDINIDYAGYTSGGIPVYVSRDPYDHSNVSVLSGAIVIPYNLVVKLEDKL